MSEMKLNETIYSLRKEREWTQEQLAQKLGVSYQAVSKWENAQACPDIGLLPALADLFGVSLDALFGRAQEAPVQKEAPAPALPWPQDDALRLVIYEGHRLLGEKDMAELAGRREMGVIRIEGAARDVYSLLSLTCEEVQGDVHAGGSVSCEEVQGDVHAGGSVSCGDVGGDVSAQSGSVSCGDVNGDVSVQSGSVSCGDVSGDVQAGTSVECGDVGGDVSAQSGPVNCSDVGGDVQAGMSVECGDVSGDVSAQRGNVTCSDVSGDVTAGGSVTRDEDDEAEEEDEENIIIRIGGNNAAKERARVEVRDRAKGRSLGQMREEWQKGIMKWLTAEPEEVEVEEEEEDRED